MNKKIEIEVPEGFREQINKDSSGKIIIDFIPNRSKGDEMKEFLKPFLTNLTIVHSEKFPNSVLFKQNGEVIFELEQDSENKEKRYFWVHYDKIWSVFYDRFDLNYNETQSFINNVVEDTLKLGSVTPHHKNSI